MAVLRRWWPVALFGVWTVVALVVDSLPYVAAPGIAIFSSVLISSVLLGALIYALVRRGGWVRVTVIALCLCASVSIGLFLAGDGPARVAYQMSLQQLNKAVVATVDGHPPATPARFGWLQVQRIELDGGLVRFVTRVDSRGSKSGLAFYPGKLSWSHSVDHGYRFHYLTWYMGYWYRFDYRGRGA